MNSNTKQKGIFYPAEIAQMRDELQRGKAFNESDLEREERAASIIRQHQTPLRHPVQEIDALNELRNAGD